MNDDDIRKERRAKMLELQRSMDHSGVDPNVRTSAPSVRQVDQFQEQYETADRRKRSAPKFFKEQPKSHGYGRRPQGDLHSEDATRRNISQRSGNSELFMEESLDADISNVFGDDKEYLSLTSSMGSVMEHHGNVSGFGHKGNNNDGAMRRPSQRPKYSSALYDSGFGTDRVAQGQFDIREAEDQLGAIQSLNKQQIRKSQSFDVKSGIRPRVDRPSSHTTKILDEDGNFVDLEDPGYISSPGSNQVRGDLLSQSLNDWKTRSHSDLTASLRSNVSVGAQGNGARCVYDSRIFNIRKPSKVGTLKVDQPGTSVKRPDNDTEAEYFEKMKQMHNRGGKKSQEDNRLCQEPKKAKNRESFKEFLSNSFSKTFSRGSAGSSSPPKTAPPPQNNRNLWPPQRAPSDVPLQEQSHRSPAHLATLDISSQSNNRFEPDPLASNDCINLTNDTETKTTSASRPPLNLRSASPNGSLLTASEFGEVDRRGRSRGLTAAHRARDMFSSSFNGLLIMIPGIGGMLGGSNGSNAHMNGGLENGPEGRWSNQREPLSPYDSYEKRDQDNRQKLPCWTLFLLLAVDIFTIILLIILFSHLHDNSAHCCQQEIDTSRGNPLPLEGTNFFPPKARASNGSMEKNYTSITSQIEIRPRGLDPSGIVSPVISRSDNQNSTETSDPETNPTTPFSTTPITATGRPVAFACYKSSPHWNEGIVTYTRCNIPTEGMDRESGTFKVKKQGVYRLSFTGLFNAQNGHRVTADIMRRNRNNVLDFLGRSAAETNEAGAVFGGVDDDIMVTGTVTVLEFLEPGDTVYIQVLIENDHKASRIHSTNNKAVHFTGQRISD
ncbi:hypothetical protein TCAL_01261 [Tigriopus californicus]|uniref:C1q domain-containing protein n=1 Tax=Tigriopus californicus TaxID=6832 RepID=A0A553PB83_TIGCA|nr:hypothetical protein TCAL_01261 [Tigriopus californicus]